jgi:hypothetical protein
MEQNMKPMTKQLAIAAFILTSVTVLSLGIRQVRRSAHRANTIESPVIADTGESTPSARPSDPEDQPRPEQPLHANASDSDKEAPSNDHSEAHTDSGKHGKTVSMTKSFKGDYAKSEGSKGFQEISVGDYENIYITGEGELWYVSEQPDGSTAKMQLHTEKINGELTIVGVQFAK